MEDRTVSQPTPGPWAPSGAAQKTSNYDRYRHLHIYAMENGKTRRVAQAVGFTREETEANARLIAAAPAIYKLIAAVATWKEREDGMVYSDEPLTEYLKEARELVKRVEGA